MIILCHQTQNRKKGERALFEKYFLQEERCLFLFQIILRRVGVPDVPVLRVGAFVRVGP